MNMPLRLIKERESPLDALVDTELGPMGVVAQTGTQAVRQIYSTLQDLGLYLARHPGERILFLLEEPEIGGERLWGIAEGLGRLWQGEVLSRFFWGMVTEGDVEITMLQGDRSASELSLDAGELQEILDKIRQNKPLAMRRPSDSYHEILRVLLVKWFRREGFLTIGSLQKETGYSYPTVKKVLKELDPWLEEQSSKSVRLRNFPETPWTRLVNLGVRAHASAGFGVAGERPRSIAVMMDKLEKNAFFKGRVAVGGVEAGRFYDEGFDLLGSPRLDLCVHHHKSFDTEKLLKTLDPALRPVKKGEAPQVVLHSLFRPVSFFREVSGCFWVDEVECLLDLMDARLFGQAQNLLRRFLEGAER